MRPRPPTEPCVRVTYTALRSSLVCTRGQPMDAQISPIHRSPRRAVIRLTRPPYGLDAAVAGGRRWRMSLNIPTPWSPFRDGFGSLETPSTMTGHRFPDAVTVVLNHLTPCTASAMPHLRLSTSYRIGRPLLGADSTDSLAANPVRADDTGSPSVSHVAFPRIRTAPLPGQTENRAFPSPARLPLPDSHWFHFRCVPRFGLRLPSDSPLCRRHPCLRLVVPSGSRAHSGFSPPRHMACEAHWCRLPAC